MSEYGVVTRVGGAFVEAVKPRIDERVTACEAPKATGTTTARTLQDRFADVVNVRDFGARGDGVTDDLDAFNLAVQAAVLSGGAVFVPAGRYVVSGKIIMPQNRFKLFGAGMDVSVILGSGQTVLGPSVEQEVASEDISIEGVGFDGRTYAPSQQCSSLVRFLSCKNIRVVSCSFMNSSGYGLGIQSRVWESYQGQGAVFGMGEDILIDGCRFIGNGHGLNQTGADTMDGCDIKFGKNVVVSNCTFRDNKDKGLDVRAANVNIIGCLTGGNSNAGVCVQFEGDDGLVPDAAVPCVCNVSGLVSDGDEIGIIISHGAEHTVRGCYVGVGDVKIVNAKSKGIQVNAPLGSISMSNVDLVASSSAVSGIRGIDISTACDFRLSNASIRGFGTGIARVLDAALPDTAPRNKEVLVAISDVAFHDTGTADIGLGRCRGTVSGCVFDTAKAVNAVRSDIQVASCDFKRVTASNKMTASESNLSLGLLSVQRMEWPEFGTFIGTSSKDGSKVVNISDSVDVFKDGGPLSPVEDNVARLGRPNNRWKELFCANGTINTSDEREKTDVCDVDDSVLRAWEKVRFLTFRFLEAVGSKGREARIHTGVVAQRVVEAFASEGLDASRYGLLCHDEWESSYEEVSVDRDADDSGTSMEKRLTSDAGDRYGIRYDEALCLEAAYQRRRADSLEARIAAIEAKMA